MGLAACIVAAYVLSLWWLLRRESWQALCGVVALTGLAVVLRLWRVNDYPAGLIEDEPKMLRCALDSAQGWKAASAECIGIPSLFLVTFGAQWVPYIGIKWACRAYSMACGVLAVPAVFAVGRGLRLAVGPSLGIAALVCCMPWAMWFSRINLGGELVFHELLLLAGLSRLVCGPPH